MVRAALGTTFLAGSCSALSSEWSVSVRRTVMRSRGSPCVLTPSTGAAGSSLYKLRPARVVVRTPLCVCWQRKRHGVFRLPEGIREANPFTSLKMTRLRGKAIRRANRFGALGRRVFGEFGLSFAPSGLGGFGGGLSHGLRRGLHSVAAFAAGARVIFRPFGAWRF